MERLKRVVRIGLVAAALLGAAGAATPALAAGSSGSVSSGGECLTGQEAPAPAKGGEEIPTAA